MTSQSSPWLCARAPFHKKRMIDRRRKIDILKEKYHRTTKATPILRTIDIYSF